MAWSNSVLDETSLGVFRIVSEELTVRLERTAVNWRVQPQNPSAGMLGSSLMVQWRFQGSPGRDVTEGEKPRLVLQRSQHRFPQIGDQSSGIENKRKHIKVETAKISFFALFLVS